MPSAGLEAARPQACPNPYPQGLAAVEDVAPVLRKRFALSAWFKRQGLPMDYIQRTAALAREHEAHIHAQHAQQQGAQQRLVARLNARTHDSAQVQASIEGVVARRRQAAATSALAMEGDSDATRKQHEQQSDAWASFAAAPPASPMGSAVTGAGACPVKKQQAAGAAIAEKPVLFVMDFDKTVVDFDVGERVSGGCRCAWVPCDEREESGCGPAGCA